MTSGAIDGGGGGAGRSIPRLGLQLRWVGARVVLAALCAGYLALAFAALYRPDPSDGMGPLETALTWLSLMGTTFLPHAGMALLAVLLLCVLLRARKTVLAGLPLLAMSLGPWAGSFVPLHGFGGRGGPIAGGGATPSGETMLVMSANLLASTRSDEALLAQIAAHHPDLILVQEVRDASAARLTAALGGEYAFVAIPREDNFGQAIFSRLPFTREPEITPRDGESPLPQVRAFVEFAGREVCVWDVHLMSPLNLERAGEQARMAWEMGARLDDLAVAGVLVVVGGDFNSPWRAQPLDALRARGFREAQREAGLGPGATWPRITALKHAPGIVLDHIAFGRAFTCVEAWPGEDTGSDHKPIFARLLLGDGG